MSIERLEKWLNDRGFSPELREERLDQVIGAYGAPGRHYHNFDHLRSSVKCLDRSFGGDWRIEGAVWFHDVVYDVHASDNELRSAEWFDAHIAPQLPRDEAWVIRNLILVTDIRRGPGKDPLEQRMVDIDLAILSEGRSRYDDYRRQIRREYAHVSAADFCEGRGRILEQCLRGPIYRTPVFQAREAMACWNLRRELRDLEHGMILD
ncbi:putative metal-dependent HD superfamily phosphohydrolase [Haloferula luteola]|uniref:Putative metal-dependent HD superfamily phosphohydrolase n=1 Tax=Haloferula luteola TaxID=595692 RepID=A0A840V4V0_9BACT|nr:phosphohydrolase [Haloferula luteola]MBB5353045.1 putative metal-dependent HD superfamily phosphohydrolase [Haloferula luteola]